jgi:hypothetical protein
MRMMWPKPMRLNPFREYIQGVRALLQGEEVEYTLDGETHPIQFQMREQRYIDVEHAIPLHVTASCATGSSVRPRYP